MRIRSRDFGYLASSRIIGGRYKQGPVLNSCSVPRAAAFWALKDPDSERSNVGKIVSEIVVASFWYLACLASNFQSLGVGSFATALGVLKKLSAQLQAGRGPLF